MSRPDVAAQASVDHWQQHGLNTPTFGAIESRQGFDRVTKAINPLMLKGQTRWDAYGRGLKVLSKRGADG